MKVRESVSPRSKERGLKRDAHNEATTSLVHRWSRCFILCFL